MVARKQGQWGHSDVARQIESAVFIDLESAAGGSLGPRRFDTKKLIDLIEEDFDAKIRIANAYADFRFHNRYIEKLHLTGVEAVQVTGYEAGKQSVDMRICCDALMTAYEQPNISRFIILANDTDYVPLVRVLRKMGKSVFLLCKKDRDYIEAAYATFCDRIVDYANLLTLRTAEDEGAEGAVDAPRPADGAMPPKATATRGRRKATGPVSPRPAATPPSPESMDLQKAQSTLVEILDEQGGFLFGSQILPSLRRKLGLTFDFSDVGYASAKAFILSFPHGEIVLEQEGLADLRISRPATIQPLDRVEEQLSWIVKNARLTADYHFNRDAQERNARLALCYETITEFQPVTRSDLVGELCARASDMTKTEANDYFSVLSQCGCFDKIGDVSPSSFALRPEIADVEVMTLRYETSMVYKSLKFLERVGRLDDWTPELQGRLFGRTSPKASDNEVYLEARARLDEWLVHQQRAARDGSPSDSPDLES